MVAKETPKSMSLVSSTLWENMRRIQNFYLRDFSKSLRNRAYTWYLSLEPGMIQDWEHMVATFKTKFFFAEAKYTLAELGRTRQYVGEDLDLYVKRFHDKALDCVDPVDEKVLVSVCLHGINDEYKFFFENLTFSSFPN